MGKTTGFKEFSRAVEPYRPVKERLLDFKEIYTDHDDEKLSVQGARCMDCGVPFCQSGEGCPVYNLIPEWNDLVYQDKWEEAFDKLMLTNNFPEVTGRVCPAVCEGACVLGITESPVAIKNLEFAIADKGFQNGWLKPRIPSNRTGKSIAIVGSGPAGIACADVLTRSGIKSNVYDKNEEIGGLLTFGIPEFKLEKSVVRRRRKILEDMGISFHLGKEIGKDIPFKKLYEEHDAVFLAMGTYTSLEGGFEGERLPGVYKAIDYLVSNTKKLLNMNTGKGEHINFKNKKVIVLGGGDTAMDCNRTAIRQGAKSVTCLYRRDEKEFFIL